MCFDFDLESRFEFHGEVVAVVDGDAGAEAEGTVLFASKLPKRFQKTRANKRYRLCVSVPQ